MKNAHIVGWGSYWPERVLTNEGIASIVDTSDEWIFTRTGIRERRIANQNETTATMAFEAAAAALAVANIHPMQIDLIIVATSTPAHIFPSTASLVQDYLGASGAGAFDLSAACTGFVYGLSMGTSAIESGAAETVLIIGAETMSRVLDWQDRGTCILFGDGAGAVVLRGLSVPGGVMASTLRSDGSGADLLYLPVSYRTRVPGMGSFSMNGHAPNTISMDGRQVFRFATQAITESVQETVSKAGLTVEDIDLIVPHQANTRIIDTAAKRLKVPREKFFLNVDRAGNTSAASIPLALCAAVEADRLKPNDNVVFVGFGGGLTWGASLVKWDATPPDIQLSQRNWRDPRYIWARGRSKIRRMGRRVGSALAGSPTPNARLKNADK
jgi:3-oxoacyl-[acyl-carrier-protein] synthase-3